MRATALDRVRDPAFHRNYARVMIAEARRRQAAGNDAMVATLLEWACRGRRRYWQAVRAMKKDLRQGELFGG
jgi:hypothetical protein